MPLCQGCLWMREGSLPNEGAVHCRHAVKAATRRKRRVRRDPSHRLKLAEVQQG